MLKEEYRIVSTAENLFISITQMHGLRWCENGYTKPDQKCSSWNTPVRTQTYKCTGREAQTQHLSALSTQPFTNQICYLYIQIIYNHFASSVSASRLPAGKEPYRWARQSAKYVLSSSIPCSLCRRGNVQLPNSSLSCLSRVWCVYQAVVDCCQEVRTCWHFAFLWEKNQLVKINFQTLYTLKLQINFSSQKVHICMREGNLKNETSIKFNIKTWNWGCPIH